jgi:hypothetical protein
MSETFPMLNGSGGNEIRDGYAFDFGSAGDWAYVERRRHQAFAGDVILG